MSQQEPSQAMLSVLSACGLEGEVRSLNCTNPQAIVLLFPKSLSQDAQRNINAEWRRVFEGKPLGDVPVIVLGGGADIKVIDRKDS